MPISYNNNWNYGPLWVRQRTIGGPGKRKMKTSSDLMKRLNQESILNGHAGSVNCLEWNQTGDSLASGSDDGTVIIWDAFRATKRSRVKPGHQGSIFSVKFMPSTNDSVIATCASDGQVRVTQVGTNQRLLTCKSCHTDRVKRLAVHPSEPNLIWSASEDGLVLQYDLRQQHRCNAPKPTNTLIDLNTIGFCIAAKCIAINPQRSEMLAVGSNDIYNRLFDRRYLRPGAWSSCTAYFAPGHLLRTNNRSNSLQSYGTTYLSFNSDGSELLASVHAEQLYLFHTYEPWERYQSFDTSIKPLLFDGTSSKTCNPLHIRSHSYQDTIIGQQQSLKDISKESLNLVLADDSLLKEYLEKSSNTPNGVVSYFNELLDRINDCPDLYRARAISLLHRDWRGDPYQALRDCCHALFLQPLDSKTIHCLATVIIKMNDREAAEGLLDFVSNMLIDNKYQEDLLRTKEALLNYKRSPSPNQTNDGPLAFFHKESLRSYMVSQYLDIQSDCTPSQYVQAKSETKRRAKSYDFSKRFCGHCNMNTDIKEANFFGSNNDFIVGGSDDGALYIWDKNTTNIVKAVHADYQILNCVQPHPSICMLATSGIEPSVKLWSSSGKLCRDVEALETRCLQNQKYISTCPLEAMIDTLTPSVF